VRAAACGEYRKAAGAIDANTAAIRSHTSVGVEHGVSFRGGVGILEMLDAHVTPSKS
jgi:hypothetical protein